MHVRYRLLTAWVIATVASILVAFAAVASVRTAIADPPSALLLPDSPPPTIELPPLSEIQQTTVPDPEVGDGAPVAAPEDGSEAGVVDAVGESDLEKATTTQPAAETSATPAQPVPTTSAQTTSTTEAPVPAPFTDEYETYETDGGWVTLRSDGQGVFLESASPKPGWTAQTEGSGPEHFTVVFKGDDQEIHFKVEFERGEVKVDIED